MFSPSTPPITSAKSPGLQRIQLRKLDRSETSKSQPPASNAGVLPLHYNENMVVMVGFEPTHPKGTDLLQLSRFARAGCQSAATLQLRRITMLFWWGGALASCRPLAY